LNAAGLAPPAVTVLTVIWFQVLITDAFVPGTGCAAAAGVAEISAKHNSSAGATRLVADQDEDGA